MKKLANIKQGYSTFVQNLESSQLPPENSITYGSMFSKYWFKFQQNDTNKVVDLTSCSQSFYKENENAYDEYIGIGMLSSKDGINEREDLNLILLLDISGSMGSRLDQQSNVQKIDLAKDVTWQIFEKLRPEERFALIIFDHNYETLQELEEVSKINKDELRSKIKQIDSRGGTVLVPPYEKAVNMMNNTIYSAKSSSVKNNRIIIITDAQINNKDELNNLIKLNTNASQFPSNIFTTFIGVGIDFQVDLVNSITKVRGSSYISTKSNNDFNKILNEDFNYIVSVSALNSYITLESDEIEIEKTYGSNYDLKDGSQNQDELQAMKDGNVLKVETLTPYAKDARGVKGGIVLVKFKRKEGIPFDQIIRAKIKITYQDINENSYQEINEIELDSPTDTVNNEAIMKAILLCQFTDTVKETIKELKQKPDVEKKQIIKDNISRFSQSFLNQTKQFEDENFNDEMKILELIQSY